MNFSPAAIFASVAFGIWGIALFRRGKDAGDVLTIAIGIALMVFPYFIENTYAIWGVGLALCLAAHRFGRA